ncbi:MAG TPA: hypothetical protein VFN18_13220 [Solirubrobacterales bacterium]|nr:hypothetical protein [Solirubrobacterales bacterium]
MRRLLFLSLFLVAMTAPSAHARVEVQPDPSFGANGTVEARFGPTYFRTAFTELAAQPDGGLLAARGGPFERNRLQRRYTAAGVLDSSVPPVEIPLLPEAVDADGKVLRASYYVLERLNPDGSPDPGFGVRPWGEGKASDDVGFKIEAIEPLPSGRILAAGSFVVHVPESREEPGRTYVAQVAVARFEHDGRLDASFGDGGVVKLKDAAAAPGERFLGLAPRADDGAAVIVLDSPPLPWGEAATHSGSTIVGLGGDGRPDPGFGVGGRIRLADASVLAFDSQPDGGLLVAGDRWGPALSPGGARASDLFAYRYTPGGHLDPAFGGGDGMFEIDLGKIDLLGDMLVEGDGSIVLGGSSSILRTPNCLRFHDSCPEAPRLLRLTPQGALDPSFGGGGSFPLDELASPYGTPGGGIGVKALDARPGGGMFVGGGSGTAAFVFALSAADALDPSFGEGGILRESDPHPSRAGVRALAIDDRGRVLVAGGTDADVAGYAPPSTLFRYLPSGQLDRSFGDGSGYVRVHAETPAMVLSVGEGAYVLSGTNGPTIAKVTARGRFDRSFGEEGTASLSLTRKIRRKGNVHRLWMKGVAMRALPSGGLLVAGTAAGGSDQRIFAVRLRADGSLDSSFGRGGLALLGFGPGLRCTANQVAFQRDGRIVFAGYLRGRPNEEHVEAFALMRMRADGTRDRSFGRGGVAVVRPAPRSVATSLAIEGNGRILAAGKTFGKAGKTRELLFRFTRRGRIDRSFGHRGLVSTRLPQAPGGLAGQPRQLLLQRGRILVLRDDEERQLVAYSRDGRHRRAFAVAGGASGDRSAPHAPFGAVRGGRLFLGWNVLDVPQSFKLQKLRVSGLP